MSLHKVDNGDGTYESVPYIIKHEYPPNIEEIRKVFPLRGGEIFAWDGIIYHPQATRLPPELIDHELCHFAQQNGDPEGWWERYLVDTEWRFKQELEAHIEEFKSYKRHNKDRNSHIRYLQLIARRLSSPMYGNVVTYREAMRRIQHGKYEKR